MKNNTDTFYKDAKKVCKNVEIKTLGEYHDLYVQSNIILIADIFIFHGLIPKKVHRVIQFIQKHGLNHILI